jgi:hypothetical protein
MRGRPDTDLPTAAQRPTGWLLFLVAAAALGCPSTSPSRVVISNVTVVGDSASTAFELEIEGRGFGLTEVVYDVKSGTGTSSAADMSVRIVEPDGRNARVIGRRLIQVLSPRLLRVQVRLDTPLRPMEHGVELYAGETLVVEQNPAFRVAGDTPTPDAGVDGGVLPDTGVPGPDADVDAGIPDTGISEDAGPPDTGLPPDSGLGPFMGGYRFRRPLVVDTPVEAPAGATLLVPVNHAVLVAGNQAKADGSDLMVRQGADPLAFQWSDRVAVGTDGLVMVVKLARAVPVGGDPADPLVLYYGDPLGNNPPTDAVFQFVERFANAPAPVAQGNDSAWWAPQDWYHCPWDRPQENTDVGYNGAVCVQDADGGASQRRTLSTPRAAGISNAPGANLTYEMSLWLAGSSPDGNSDMFYFAYGPDNDTYQATTVLPPDAWRGYLPSGSLTFQEINGANRTVVGGWNLPPTQTWWQRATARFTPTVDRPSLHLRNVSNRNGSNAFIGVDDWWVRLAVEPEPQVSLGPEEARP